MAAKRVEVNIARFGGFFERGDAFAEVIERDWRCLRS